MLGLLKKTNGNVDQALVLAKKKLAAELRELLDISCSTLLMNSRRMLRRTRNTGPCEQGLLKGLLTLKWQYSGSPDGVANEGIKPRFLPTELQHCPLGATWAT